MSTQTNVDLLTFDVCFVVVDDRDIVIERHCAAPHSSNFILRDIRNPNFWRWKCRGLLTKILNLFSILEKNLSLTLKIKVVLVTKITFQLYHSRQFLIYYTVQLQIVPIQEMLRSNWLSGLVQSNCQLCIYNFVFMQLPIITKYFSNIKI